MKLRRKHQTLSTNESEIENAMSAHPTSPKVGNRLVKSCSFSGKPSLLLKDAKTERYTVSDPSCCSRNKNRYNLIDF